jgi:hypothetical protein
MITNAQPNVASPQAAGMRSEIGQKWNKCSAADIAGLKTKDDLVTLVQSKYSLERSQAQRDVDAFAKGRQL